MPPRKKKRTPRKKVRKAARHGQHKRTPRVKRGARPRAPRGLLVIHCDAVKLAADRFTVGRETIELIGRWVPKLPLRVIDACSDADLLAGCARLFEEGFKASVVLLVGHSNCDVLKLTAESAVSWASVAEWLRPFDPRHVVVFGCEGGRTLPGAALVKQLPRLEAIHGSPLKHTNAEMRVLAVQVLLLVTKTKLPAEADLLLRGANALLTGGLLFTRTREELLDGGDAGVATKHFAEELFKALLPRQ